jgi:cell division protein FtsQ
VVTRDDEGPGPEGTDTPDDGDGASGGGKVATAPGRSSTGTTRPVVAPVAVDPRMRRRRIGVRRDAGRRRLKRITLGLAVAAVVVGAAVATRTPLLDVDRVDVAGVERTTADQVRNAAGIDRGDPLISVDPGAVARRVEELPWVDSARVERSWPSTVEVQVTERVAVAVVQLTDDHAAVVDADGRVLVIEPRAADAEPDPEGPLVLTGVDGTVREGERLGSEAREALEVAVAVAERMPGVVAAVATDLDAALVQGGAIRFGDTDDLDAKVTAAKTVLSEVDTACLELLDVRVPGSPALTRNQRCS